MTRNRWLLFIGCILMGLQGTAQFTLTREIRPRSEYRHGFQTLMGPDENAAFFISQRSRLNFGFQSSEIQLFISLQDVRVWGEVPQLNRSDMNSSVHQAWAEIPLRSNMALKLLTHNRITKKARLASLSLRYIWPF